MTTANPFPGVIAVLDAIGVPYMLTGSFASAYHGVPRATQDIDIVVAPTRSQIGQLVERFQAVGYYVDENAALEALAGHSQFNVIDPTSGWKIDFICRRDRPFSRMEFDRRSVAEFDGQALYIATAEDVLLAKMEWGKLGDSARQLEDAAGLLRVRRGDLDMAYLLPWITALDLARQWEEVQSMADDPPGPR